MRDLRAGTRDRGRHALDRAVANQIADVRNHPGRAGIGKLVVVELVEIALDHGDLLRDQHQQGLERPSRGLREERIELLLLNDVQGRERPQRGELSRLRGRQEVLRLRDAGVLQPVECG